MSTLDLLLELGGKLADLTNTLTKRRPSKAEEQQLVQVSSQYKELLNQYVILQNIIQVYNASLGNSDMRAIYNVCTHEFYNRAAEYIRNMANHQVIKMDLKHIQFISLNLTRNTKEVIRFSNVEANIETQAEVYAHEKWILFYSNGAQEPSYAINKYILIWSEGGWKLANSQVFQRIS
ncbi:MAG: hypothetical protein EI684_12780 [Candidatus Viridilinea halotolerans]|uniref:Tim44-like domain-containing protein n=1 Tax=Candidatus Viridilinea halotolerans TaxID=2491704 RepID=A0A426TXW2_9CHLR|nr:MAG: hypothetical protein EI684_12780 [Candidatus Viridilinea halotolerans]